MFDGSGDLLNFPTFEMPDILNFRKQAPTPIPQPSILPTHLMTRPVPPLLSVFSFLMLPKPKVAFFLCILLLCSICVVFFSPQFERDSTVYVYKLNEDEMIILYKHS